MAAESGLVRAKVWFDDPANAGLWGDSVGTLAAINAGQQNLQNSAQWRLTSVDYVSHPDFALLVSVGTISHTGVTRKVQALYQQAKASGNLAAMNIIGKKKNLSPAQSARGGKEFPAQSQPRTSPLPPSLPRGVVRE